MMPIPITPISAPIENVTHQIPKILDGSVIEAKKTTGNPMANQKAKTPSAIQSPRTARVRAWPAKGS